MKSITLWTLVVLSLSELRGQSAAAIVAKHLEAMGGRRKLSAIQTVSIQMDLQTDRNKGYMHLQIMHRRGLLLEQALRDFTNVRLITQKGVWVKGPADESFRALQPTPNPRALYASLSIYEHFLPLHLLDYDKRALYISLKHKLRKVNKVNCYVVEVRAYTPEQKEPLSKMYYIGTADYLIYKLEEPNKVTDFSDYKSVDGIIVPHQQIQHISTARGFRGQGSGQKINLTLTKIEINPTLAEDTFMPLD